MAERRRFIDEPIQAEFTGQPLLSKKTGCPAAFRWRTVRYAVTELLAEWHEYGRRGRMADNMSPAHAEASLKRGSFGVGRDYYRVRTDAGRTFTMYYDRAVRSSDAKLGEWFLLEEELESGKGDSPKSGAP
jgi:hypothetical protein